MHLSKDTLVVSLGSSTSRKMFTCGKKSFLDISKVFFKSRNIYLSLPLRYTFQKMPTGWTLLRAVSRLGDWTQFSDLTATETSSEWWDTSFQRQQESWDKLWKQIKDFCGNKSCGPREQLFRIDIWVSWITSVSQIVYRCYKDSRV